MFKLKLYLIFWVTLVTTYYVDNYAHVVHINPQQASYVDHPVFNTADIVYIVTIQNNETLLEAVV